MKPKLQKHELKTQRRVRHPYPIAVRLLWLIQVGGSTRGMQGPGLAGSARCRVVLQGPSSDPGAGKRKVKSHASSFPLPSVAFTNSWLAHHLWRQSRDRQTTFSIRARGTHWYRGIYNNTYMHDLRTTGAVPTNLCKSGNCRKASKLALASSPAVADTWT